jgi:hypothetical protein
MSDSAPDEEETPVLAGTGKGTWSYPPVDAHGEEIKSKVDPRHHIIDSALETTVNALRVCIEGVQSHIDCHKQIIADTVGILGQNYSSYQDEKFSKRATPKLGVRDQENGLFEAVYNIYGGRTSVRCILGVAPIIMFVSSLHQYLLFLGDDYDDEIDLVTQLMTQMRGWGEGDDKIETKFGDEHMPNFSRQPYYRKIRVTSAEQAFQMMEDQMTTLIPSQYKLTAQLERDHKLNKNYLESYLGKDQRTISKDPKDNLMDVWKCMGAMSHFLNFLYHLDDGAYPGSFKCLGDIDKSSVFLSFGKFMSQYERDLQQEKVPNYIVLERQLDWFLEATSEEYGRKTELFPKRIDNGNNKYFDGWCRPKDWAVTIDKTEAKKPRAKRKVEIICPVCKLTLKVVDERLFPFPRTESGEVNYVENWNAEKHNMAIEVLRGHFIEKNNTRSRNKHALLPMCARYRRVKMEYGSKVHSKKREQAIRQKLGRTLKGLEDEVTKIKRKAQTIDKTRVELLELARKNGFKSSEDEGH